jgi:hypothetical protein
MDTCSLSAGKKKAMYGVHGLNVTVLVARETDRYSNGLSKQTSTPCLNIFFLFNEASHDYYQDSALVPGAYCCLFDYLVNGCG